MIPPAVSSCQEAAHCPRRPGVPHCPPLPPLTQPGPGTGCAQGLHSPRSWSQTPDSAHSFLTSGSTVSGSGHSATAVRSGGHPAPPRASVLPTAQRAVRSADHLSCGPVASCPRKSTHVSPTRVAHTSQLVDEHLNPAAKGLVAKGLGTPPTHLCEDTHPVRSPGALRWGPPLPPGPPSPLSPDLTRDLSRCGTLARSRFCNSRRNGAQGLAVCLRRSDPSSLAAQAPPASTSGVEPGSSDTPGGCLGSGLL